MKFMQKTVFLVALWTIALPAWSQTMHHIEFGDDAVALGAGGLVSILPDLNGDGIEDYLFGNSTRDTHYVVSGSDWSLLHSEYAPSPTQWHAGHGASWAPAGDWDADGVDDYVVGAPGYSPSPGVGYGILRIYSGATHQELAQVMDPTFELFLGGRVYGLGDINGDGWPEVATTTNGDDVDGIRIYSAPNATLLRSHPLEGHRYKVVKYGDWDGDGCVDYMINHLPNGPFLGAGGVILYSGATGVELLVMTGTQDLDRVGTGGRNLCAGGDWNADGVDDIVVGAPGSSYPGYSQLNRPLSVYVYSGSDGALLRTFEGLDYSINGSNFGFSVDSGFDVNGDNFPDLIVGAPGYSFSPGGFNAGAYYVISGLTGSVLWSEVGPGYDTGYGAEVGFIPDRNGDGLAEWLVQRNDFNPLETWWAIYHGAPGDAWDLCSSYANGGGGPRAHLRSVASIGLRSGTAALALEHASPGSLAFLFVGVPSPAIPFGQGELCIGSTPVFVASAATGTQGEATFELDLWSPPLGSAASPLIPGDTRAFQVLYRNAAVSARDSSNAVAVQFLP